MNMKRTRLTAISVLLALLALMPALAGGQAPPAPSTSRANWLTAAATC